ncbi:hypothetical protein [Parvularcula oceani]|uniref:hypothetical protein n=1 Tax=Parvularcula oceani TaxID=1247963 RepID=UPI0004E15A28|nr:hypothetical protein [Parvularcula oceani]
MRALPAALLALALCACSAVRPAEMALPDGVRESTQRILLSGIGSARTGTVTAAGFSGPFERSASRFDLSGRYSSSGGGAFFALTPAGGGPVLSGECETRLKTVGFPRWGVSADVLPLAYSCRLSRGGSVTDIMEVQEARGRDALFRNARRGMLTWENIRLDFESVHAIEGSPLGTADALGYRVLRDGAVIGAVDLNGAPSVLMPTTAEPALREAMIVGAVALGLFWDPATLD